MLAVDKLILVRKLENIDTHTEHWCDVKYKKRNKYGD